jgi:hypothetical protein
MYLLSSVLKFFQELFAAQLLCRIFATSVLQVLPILPAHAVELQEDILFNSLNIIVSQQLQTW